MKKLLSLFVPLMALFLTLAPLTARAQINEYFSIQSNWSSTTVTLKTAGTPNVNLEYSTDKSTWNPVEVGTAINVYTKTYFRGNNPTGFSKDKSNYAYFKMYSSSTNITLAGNIMSLINGSDFATNYSTIPNKYCFYRLFYQENSATQSNCHQFNATAMSLPAEYLTTGCYMQMFELTNIYYLPQLPSQHLADSCYFKMFYRCQSIQTHAAGSEYVLPAEELAPHCYEYMLGRYTEGTNYTNRYEIMATSLKDRRGNDIARCLGHTFEYQSSGTKANYWYVTIYFNEWGSNTSTTCPTYQWFYGSKNTGKNYFNKDSNLPKTINGSANDGNNFPYYSGSYITNITPSYLTFNCAANNGTWESGSAYNTDLRRVVRANYTAKTIPAPPVKENARFLGWFTTASGEGSMLTEDELKQKTTATTVYARFVDDSKYTFFVNPSDKGTITVTDNNGTAYTPGILYILDSNDKTFTLSCTGVTSGYSFYRWIGGQVDDNTVMFREGQKDLVITGVITPASGFDNASGTVYLSGSGAGTSNKVSLPSEAVDLGAAGIWAKYNVDKTTANGFASSETATGSYFAWGMTDIGSGYAGAASMSDGENLPVTVETDAAYKFCGNKWRIATKDEWATLLNNSTLTYVNTYDAKFTANGNSITLGHNGYQNNTGTNYFNTVIKYWTSTYYGLASSTQTAYAFAGTYNSGRYNPPTRSPILNYYTDENYSDGYNYIQYGYAIRPILNVNKRTLTIHTLHLDEDDNPVTRDYIYECDLNQNITVTATADEQGFIFDHWEDSDGNLYSEDNPLTFRVYDNLEFTAVFEFGTLIEHHVTFYDEDGSTVLYEADFREGKKPVYRGSTPTKAGGYVFNGWSPAITKLGESDATYTATYLKTYTITASAAHGTVELTPASPTDQVSEGVYKTGTSLTMTVTADPGYVFTQWSDGNTNNPRTVAVTADASYTAEFRIESLPAVVDAYQNAPKDVKQILYLLAEQTGNDDITYRPVDMGYGIAFANKNIGAADSTQVGTFFYWGDIEGHSTFGSSQKIDASGMANGAVLPAEKDAAYKKMGECWRMPTDQELVDLKNIATVSGNMFTNPNNASKKIWLPATGGYVRPTSTTLISTKTNTSYSYYWSSVVYASGTNRYPWILLKKTDWEVNVSDGSYNMQVYYGMPVRAVYVPSYTPVTLTINAGERQYIYYCQPGQQVTVTAHPNTAANYLFDEWEDNHSTNPERTFTVTGNVTYTAKMKDNPLATSHTVTFQDYDGTTLQAAYSLIDGRVPVYSGAEPSRKGYRFTGWTDGNDVFTDKDTALPALTGDVVYTATYIKEPYLTITNTHASANTSVSMSKSNKSMANKTFYIRIINAAGEVTTNWTTKNVNLNNTNAVSFGSIPAGGKMQIYGNGGNTATSTSYYDYFVISGGTPEVSGNILSLITCSDGENVDNNHTLSNYSFYYLFKSCTAITNAEDLELPSNILSTYAYANMFNGCTGLKKAPKELPATTLASNCYQGMFSGCSGLTTAPAELPALTLPPLCYYEMFKGCTALISAPEIAGTSMSSGNNQQCYAMFQNCSTLVKAPSKLLVESGLTTNAYGYMFASCASLEKAPDIYATSYAASSTNNYNYMFDGCTKLNQIRTYQTAWGKSNYWVRNVANTGVIYCPPTLSRATYGTNNMPKTTTYQWTVFSYNVTFNPVGCAWTDATSSNKQFTWKTDTTNVMKFLRAESAADATFYTDAECTEEISIEAIKAYLEEQQEASAETTKNYYVRKVSAYELSWDANGGALDGTAGEDYTAAGSVNAGATITAPTATRTGYTFTGWSPAFTGTMPAANTEYVAQWEINKYTVTIAKNEDDWGSLTDESENVRVINNVPYGTTISNSGATVTINGTPVTATPAAATAQYTYGFDSWTNGTETVTGNMTVTANFTRTTNTYDITWKSEDGTSTLETDAAQAFGATTAYNGAVPTKSATGYTYTFDGWATSANGEKAYNNGETPTVSGAATYYAHFSATTNTYTLTWTTDGNTLTGDYTHGEAIAYGTTIIAPNTPTKNATAQYTYTFNGWEPALDATMPDNDVTYTATWTETKRQYTLTWDVNGGNALTGTYTNGTIDWGTDIVKPADPTKSGYTFGGWDANNDGKADEVAKTMPTTSLTYKAIWVAELPNITLCENCENDHYDDFKSDYDGETVNVTYPRQFAANRWSTMCLPFSIELPEMIVQKMYGRVYEFKYATGNANTNSGVNLYFSNAKKIEAGKCYIVNANDALAAKTSFVFSGVTIDLTKDNGADLSSPETPEASMAAYNALPGYKSEGTIELVGTLRNGTLQGSATGNRYMGLKENKIYYPNISQGSTIWAYRGIFRSSEILDKQSMQKMRIIVDGEDRGELIIDADGDILAPSDAQSRKFIENGVLYIEREGVIYDAQGKRVESSF